jgi:hypothetical protein
MSLLNNIVVTIIKVDFQRLLKALLLLSSLDLRFKKLRIIKKILSKTSIILKDLGNNNNLGFSPLKAL